MQTKSHLIHIHRTLRDGGQIIEYHSFFRRINAPTVDEALTIAKTRFPSYDVAPYDERDFLTTRDEILSYVRECVS